jgi:hypothetical protein
MSITETKFKFIYIIFLGFNYEINSLTSSSNELASAYHFIFDSPITPLRIALNLLSNYIPSVREIPLEVNKRFKSACAVTSRVSQELVEERYNEAKNGELKGKDLLSLLININNTLPTEEKMTDEELRYQVISRKLLVTIHLLNCFFY